MDFYLYKKWAQVKLIQMENNFMSEPTLGILVEESPSLFSLRIVLFPVRTLQWL